ncbi:Fe-S protein, homolog of lactate dehydrogenase SO1521 [hydrothermal vent metagenome]|uniref:Fe-S protein, homolog of lactate dehydrogenase SO1521 n=1 Tax=hydrothermal vent metagenome TaxID=652676 RepID=A0A3B1B7K6_9ZZZZ
MPADLTPALIELLGADNVLTEASERLAYGYDNSRQQALPALVVFPENHAQVRGVVRLCHEHRTALTARGRGTGTTGATVPLKNAIVLSTERMTRILEMNPADRLMVVQPGVTNQTVQQAAAEHGFFWPPDPTSAAVCTIGGNLAYNSAGPRAVKYGTPRENTLGLRAVTGAGEEIHTGTRTTKGVVGYDLTRLLIGSEGTLAIITEATLKLTPLAESKRTLRAIYADMHSAAQAVSRIMAQPIVPCALEFIDGPAIEMVRQHSTAELPQGAGALLMIEVDGAQAAMAESLAAIEQAASGDGLLDLRVAQTQAEVQALWATRKALSPALRNVAPKKINEDVVVPVSQIPALIASLTEFGERHGITIVNFGHAGNGNIHVNLLVDPDDGAQMARAEACLDAIFARVLELGGSLSGEHGIGLVKRDFVAREIDPVSLALMQQIRRLFDPHGILNPGKTLPA